MFSYIMEFPLKWATQIRVSRNSVGISISTHLLTTLACEYNSGQMLFKMSLKVVMSGILIFENVPLENAIWKRKNGFYGCIRSFIP